jgi:flagellar motor component MotA
MIRYFAWFIPTLGFIGTVIGIALALSTAGNPPDVGDSEALREWMQALTRDLGVAFNTTLVALMLSSVLVLLMHIAQEMEELALNKSAQYCLDNLINRLWTK